MLQEEFKKELEKELNKRFDEFRNQGINIGWYAFAVSAINNIKNMHSIKEVKAYFKSEKEKAENRLNINVNNKNVE